MSLRLFIGPMFAGKSTRVLTIVRRFQSVRRNVCIITHSLDTRYTSTPALVSHDHQKLPALAGATLMPFLTTSEFANCALLVIEEAQFFPDLVEFVDLAVDTHKKHVVVVGLDGDSERRPFGDILRLVPKCDSVEKLMALCTLCGDGTEAPFTFSRKEAVSESVPVVGADETYMPLCRKHYLDQRFPRARKESVDLYRHGC